MEDPSRTAVEVGTDFDHIAAATERVVLYLLCHLSQMEYPWSYIGDIYTFSS